MSKRILSVVLALTLLLSVISVAGFTTTSAAGVTVTPVTAVPAGSLLAGLRPVSGIEGQTALTCYGGTALKNLTDGVFVDSAQTGRWMGWTSSGSRISFNLGAVAEVSQFLVGSEAGADQYADKVKIYVSKTVCDPRTELYAEGNLVADVTGLKAAQNNLVTMSGAVKAIMIGFDFTGSTCNAYDTIRLGELGAYGTQNAVAADTTVSAVTALPTETNLLKTATATINNSGGNDSRLTDDVLCTDAATRWQCATYRWGNQTWDLGDIYDIDKVLIGSEYGSEQFVKFVNIYVSNDKATLFTADTLVLSANGYYSGIGANKDNLLSSASDKAIQGRYVGFEFTNNSTYNGGHMASFLRLGELGVYGTKVAGGDVPEEPTNDEYVLLDESIAGDKAITAEDNLLSGAVAYCYQADVATSSSTNTALVSNFSDGSIKTGGTLNTGNKNDGAQYIYVNYDLGESKTIRSLYYAANGTVGVNSVGVYVGDENLAGVMGTDPDIFYDGAIGTNTDYMKNNVTDAVAILFDKELTGRYVTFRLGVGHNSGWAMVWISEMSASSKAPVREVVTYNADEVASSLTPAADNLLKSATAAYYRSDAASSNSNDDAMTGTFVDNDLSTGKAINGWSAQYIYVTYDLGAKCDITSLYYASQMSAGPKYTGVNSIGVYVGDKDLADIVGTEPDIFYDGAVGTNTDYMKNNVTDAVAIRFNKKMTGRYVTFRVATGKNGNYQMAWISEFAATGTKIAFTEKGVNSTADLPEKENMVLGKTPYKLDGTSISLVSNGGAITNVNDGKIQGIDQPITYLLSDTEKTAERGGVTYYNPIAPKEFVEKYYPDYDSSKTWYFKSQNGQWRDSNVSTTRAMMNSANAQFVYDLGAISKIEDILIASSWELQGMGANGVTTEAGVYKPTLEQVEATMSPLKGDSLLYKVEVYVADEFEDLLDATKAKRIIAYNHSKDVGNMNVVNLFTLTEAVEGRYVYFDLTGSTNGNLTRVSELAVYGELGEIPVSLIAGDLPVVHGQINARGIDNKTAVDAFGNPGTGNTGTLSGMKKVWKPGDISLLTDGSADTRANQHVASAVSDGGYLLYYDTYWVAFVYKLDGPSRIDEIIVSSSNESDYHIAGVQYYAANQYADLFKNESLLYTTGGEHYVVDEANSNEDKTAYLPDEQYDMNTKRHLSYKLTAEQQNGDYRYVGIILTRPYGMWQRSKPGTRLQGYTQYRVSEFNVYGETLSVDEPITDTYAVETSKGEATVQVGPLHFDDRDFFFNTLGGVKVTETKLPDTVNRNIYGNWLSVADDTVFTFQLLDKNGNVIPETDANEVLGVNNREIEIWMPATGSKTSTMAVLEDDTLRRLYNSFVDVNHANMVCAGCLEYPTYEGTYDYVNNRDKAILTGGTNSLVYMEFNDIDTINKLNDRMVNQPLKDFITDLTVAGVTEEAAPRWPLWLILSAAGAAVAVTAVILVRRRARRAHS